MQLNRGSLSVIQGAQKTVVYILLTLQSLHYLEELGVLLDQLRLIFHVLLLTFSKLLVFIPEMFYLLGKLVTKAWVSFLSSSSVC